MKLDTRRCKARASLRRALCFVRERWQIFRQRPKSRNPLRPVALAASRSVSPPSLNTRCGESLGLLRQGDQEGIAFNQHYLCDGAVLFKHACALGCEGVVSKRLGSPYRSGRVDHWLKVKNPAAPAVRREAEEDWGRKRPQRL
jgi:hypothetical protein